MEKRFCVTHQFNYSVVHNLTYKVNKHVALRLWLDSMVPCVLLSATVLEVSLLNRLTPVPAIISSAKTHPQFPVPAVTGSKKACEDN